ncbi:Splicing factor 3B subunit 2 [Verticillium dahliae VDG1]|nr:Splicing factor 3B subunit 2 [Verticillium dahliae VDG1]
MDTPVWFITGASSGFGFEIAKVALARSHKVIATARNTTKLARLADLGATVIPLDVTAPESTIRAALAEAHSLHGHLTHVINSAGYVLDGAVEECTADEVAAMYATNVLGTHKVTRAAAPYLRAQGAGVVANFGSLGSWVGSAACAHYCATKSGVAEGRAIPLRLVLGTDCLATVRQKCKDTVALLDEWQDVSASTDFVV